MSIQELNCCSSPTKQHSSQHVDTCIHNYSTSPYRGGGGDGAWYSVSK